MNIYTDLLEKSREVKREEKELLAMRTLCLRKMAEDGLDELKLPGGKISIKTKKPNLKKIDDPDIKELQEQLALAIENMEQRHKKEIYDFQRSCFLLERELMDKIWTAEVRGIQNELFEKIHIYSQNSATPYLIVRT